MKQVINISKFNLYGLGLALPALLGAFGLPWWGLMIYYGALIFWVSFQQNAPISKSRISALPDHLAPEVLSSYISNASVATLLLDRNKTITLCNGVLRNDFPSIEPGQSFVQIFRFPALNLAIDNALQGEMVAPVLFENSRQSNQFFQAKIVMLNTPFDELLKSKLLIEFTDVTTDTIQETMRKDFIANASHELRTPLTAIQAGLETIISHDDPATTAHFLPIMKTQADRMQRLIEDLMSLSKIESQKTIAPEMKIEICAVLGDVLKLYETKNAMRIENLFGDTKAFVNADGDQITQVLINLIDNALKYAAEGEKIQILRFHMDRKHEGKIGLCVKDFGKGIDKKLIPRLSERFFRVGAGDKDGTGLGLAIVKHIMRRHKGDLQIDSERDQGSEFTIWLKLL